tara:strand:- start:623 stop:1510 length:888 start_codon:yes stop_codon:yes gene_type:complete
VSSKKKLVSILILTYEGEAIIEKTIQGVFNQKLNENFDIEVIVLDNGSSDNTFERIKKDSRIHLLRNDKNLTFTKAYNKLFRKSSGDLVLILSNDVYLKDNYFLNKAVKVLEVSAIGAVAPKSIKSNEEIERIPKKETTFLRLFHDYTFLGFIMRLMSNKNYIDKEYDLDSEILDPDVLQDSCLLLKREALEPNRVFDEKLDFYYTEDYLCDFLRNKGYKLSYLDSSFVQHLYRFSTKKMGKIRISWIYLKDAMFFSIYKFGLLRSIIFLVPLALFTYFVRVFFWMIRGQLSWKD